MNKQLSYNEFMNQVEKFGLKSFRAFDDPKEEFKKAVEENLDWLKSRYESFLTVMKNYDMESEEILRFCKTVANDLRFIY